MAQLFDIPPNQTMQWHDQLLESATNVFGREGKAVKSEPNIDVKTLHAKIGELALENDFLETTLTKTGLLSAKR